MNSPSVLLRVSTALLLTCFTSAFALLAQDQTSTSRAWAPLNIPRPGPTNDAPYSPQPILQGGIVIPLYPPDSPQLDAVRIREAEYYNLSKSCLLYTSPSPRD